MANWTQRLRAMLSAWLLTAIGVAAMCLAPASAYAADGYEPMGFYTKAESIAPYTEFRSDFWATDGNVAYCLNLGQLPPTEPGAQPPAIYSNGWSWENEIYSAIALNGYPNTTVIGGVTFDASSARAATQIAIWMAAGQVDDAGKGLTAEVDYATNDQKREIVRAARTLKNDAISGKLKAPRYTKRYYGGERDGQKMQDMLWVPFTVEVRFTKTSADATITGGNKHYAYEGASYDIFRASDNVKVASITTDSAGHADCTLKPGISYYAVETKAPAGFKLSNERIPFTALEGTDIALKDHPGKFSLTVSKRDSATGAEAQTGTTLEGAEFRLTSVSTPNFTRTATTDRNGCLSFDDVPLGTVKVVETKAPQGYKLDPTVREYTVTAQDFAKGTVNLVPEGGFLEDVIAFDIAITKSKDDGTHEGSAVEHPAEGVAFDIISNTSGDSVGRITTDRNGKATTAGQWFGKGTRPNGVKGALPYDAAGYTVHEVETTVPAGYERVEDWTIDTAHMIDGAMLNYIVRNRVLSSRLQIVKEDADTGLVVPLAGFSFQILDAKGKPVSQESWYPSHETLDRFTTDESGTVTLPQRLAAGSYRVHEITAQPPYVLADNDVAFEVGGTTGSDAPLVTVRIRNDQATGRAEIIKRCAEDGKGLSGAEFDVIAQEDIISPDGTVWAVAEQVVDHVTTGGGVASVEDLRLGGGTARYAFVETKPAAGHVLDPTPVPFELTYTNTEVNVVTASVEMANEPTVVELDKTVLNSGEPLQGAIFELWNSADEVEPDDDRTEVEEEDGVADIPLREGAEARKFTTDENGHIRIDHLEAGTYRLREIAAPDGFVADQSVLEFTVDAEGHIDGKGTHQVKIANDYTKIEISKRDISNEEEIPGAALTLYDSDGNVVDEWVSNNEPHRIERLKPGVYTLREQRTPRHHDLAEDVTFTVGATGDVQKVAMYDEPISIEGELDKRQEIADPTAENTEANGDGANRAETKVSEEGDYRYSLDFRSTSNTWTDEFTVEDEFVSVETGLAELKGIETPIAEGDFDGKLNIWFRTNRQEDDGSGEAPSANATRDDGHENPWLNDETTKPVLGDDGRALDYTGWHLWQADVPADEATALSVEDLDLAEGEQIVAIRFEYGRVEAGFTTRTDRWDRDDLKHEHDDSAGLDLDEREDDLAPAVIHMRVTDRYVAGTELENTARVDLFRNGGGDGLEDHDSDYVIQVPKDVPLPLPQTGVLPMAGLLALASAGAWSWRRHLHPRKERMRRRNEWRNVKTHYKRGARP